MMDFRQRLEQSRNKPASIDPPQPEEPLEDAFTSSYFGTDRGNHPNCLDLRIADGSRKAIPYAYISEITFSVDGGIEILTPTKRIRITGRCLMSLYEYLITYRVRYVQAHQGHDAAEDGVFVKDIIHEAMA